MLTDKQKELILELLECQNCVEDDQYEPENIAVLSQMRRDGLVSLVWMVTAKGKKEIGK